VKSSFGQWGLGGTSQEKSRTRFFDELSNWEEVLQGSSLVDPVPATKAKRESVDASIKSGDAV
jgi:hypothetical protein